MARAFLKNVDGRIDDPKAGWKGRALWSTTGTRTLFHNEGGIRTRHKAIRFQLRPHPLDTRDGPGSGGQKPPQWMDIQ